MGLFTLLCHGWLVSKLFARQIFYEWFVDGALADSVTNLRKQTLLLANLPQEEEDKNIIVPLRVGRYSEENVTSGFEMRFK